MKQFLYLDTDIINSVIAQHQKGLITQQTMEAENSTNKNAANTQTVDLEGSGSAAFWKFAQAEAKFTGEFGFSHSKETGESSKSIIEKTLHDASFDIAYDIIQPIKISMAKDECDGEGCYVELDRVFDFVDLDYLQNLFSPNGLIDFIKKSEAAKIEEAANQLRESLNREQTRSKGTDIKKKANEAVKENNKKYDDICEIIAAMRGFLPYNRMLISHDGYLIPLDDHYFRIDPKNLGFKYGGSITCVGMVTNVIGIDTEPLDSSNVFATLQYLANEVLRKLLPTDADDLWVVHPIAVYYGN